MYALIDKGLKVKSPPPGGWWAIWTEPRLSSTVRVAGDAAGAHPKQNPLIFVDPLERELLGCVWAIGIKAEAAARQRIAA
jgi:hypothetical protein